MKNITDLIVSAIKNRKKDVVSFIQKHGGVIKKGDSNIVIGQQLAKVLANNTANQKEFALLLEPLNFVDAIAGAVEGLGGMFSAAENRKAAEQQGSDAITLALINAGIAKSSATNWPLVIGLSAAAIIVIIIGLLVYKKYSK